MTSGLQSEPSAESAIPVAFLPPPQRWQLVPLQSEESSALAASARIPAVLAQLLLARGITNPAAVFEFLNPEIAQLHDPFQMLGMAAAVDRLELAIARQETILLYGDYDVDGTTAVVLLKTAIEMLAWDKRRLAAAPSASTSPTACARATASNPPLSKQRPRRA